MMCARTNLVEQQNNLLVRARLSHIALHIRCAAAERVPRIKHLHSNTKSPLHSQLEKSADHGRHSAAGMPFADTSRQVSNRPDCPLYQVISNLDFDPCV